MTNLHIIILLTSYHLSSLTIIPKERLWCWAFDATPPQHLVRGIKDPACMHGQGTDSDLRYLAHPGYNKERGRVSNPLY